MEQNKTINFSWDIYIMAFIATHVDEFERVFLDKLKGYDTSKVANYNYVKKIKKEINHLRMLNKYSNKELTQGEMRYVKEIVVKIRNEQEILQGVTSLAKNNKDITINPKQYLDIDYIVEGILDNAYKKKSISMKTTDTVLYHLKNNFKLLGIALISRVLIALFNISLNELYNQKDVLQSILKLTSLILISKSSMSKVTINDKGFVFSVAGLTILNMIDVLLGNSYLLLFIYVPIIYLSLMLYYKLAQDYNDYDNTSTSLERVLRSILWTLVFLISISVFNAFIDHEALSLIVWLSYITPTFTYFIRKKHSVSYIKIIMLMVLIWLLYSKGYNGGIFIFTLSKLNQVEK